MSLGRDNATWCHPAGALAADGWDCVVDDSSPGLVAHRAAHRHPDAPVARSSWSSAATRPWCCPLDGGVLVDVAHRRADTESFAARAAGPASSPAPTDVAYAPPGSTLRLRPPRRPARRGCRARRGVPRAHRRRHRHPSAVPAGRRGARRAARRGHRVAPGAQLRRSGRARRAPDDRRRGRSPRPATGARGRRTSTTPTGPGSRPSSRRSTGSRRSRPTTRGTDPVGYQRVYGTDGAADRRRRRGAHG